MAENLAYRALQGVYPQLNRTNQYLGNVMRITLNSNILGLEIADLMDDVEDPEWRRFFEIVLQQSIYLARAQPPDRALAPTDNRFRIMLRIGGAWKSTSFTTDPVSELVNMVFDWQERYDAGTVEISEIAFEYIALNRWWTTGSGGKSESIAEGLFYIVDTFSKYDCFWHAAVTCLNPTEDMLTNSAKRQAAGSKLKNKVRKHFKIPPGEKWCVTKEEQIKKFVEYKKCTVIVYNNLFEIIGKFNPTELNSKYIEIQMTNNHSKALIRRKNISSDISIPEKGKVESLLGYLKKKEGRTKGREDVFIINESNGKRKYYTMGEKFDSEEEVLAFAEHNGQVFVKFETLSVSLISKISQREDHDKNEKVATWDLENAVKASSLEGKMHTYMSGIAFRPQNPATRKPIRNSQPIVKQWEGLRSVDLFMEFLHKNRYFFDGYKLYAHNGGRHDLYFIYNEYLIKHWDKWEIKEFIEVDGCIIKMVIRSSDGYKITFLDSFKMAPISLDDLCKSLNTNTKKMTGDVPHEKITVENYKSFGQKLRQYHINDCVCLLEAIELLIDSVYESYKMDFTRYCTAPGLSVNIFWKKYYNEAQFPIYRLSDEIDDFIRKGYQGGRTEMLYLGYAENIWYGDKVSLYPAVGCFDLPWGEPKWIEENEMNSRYAIDDVLQDDFYGWCEVYVESTNCDVDDDFIPLIGIKYSSEPDIPKKLIFPKIRSMLEPIVVFSETIKYAQNNNIPYKFKFLKGLYFNRAPIMKQFFTDLFNERAECKKKGDLGGSYLKKLAMNSTYGKFAFRTKNRETVKLYRETYVDFYRTYHDNKLKNISTKGKYTMICRVEDVEANDTCIAISAAITAYGQLELYKVFRENQLADKRTKSIQPILAADTDSAIGLRNFDEDPIMKKTIAKDGKSLGAFKNEFVDKLGDFLKETRYTEEEKKAIWTKAKQEGCRFDRGIFLGAKMYYLEYDLPPGEIECSRKLVASAFKGLAYEKSDKTFTKKAIITLEGLKCMLRGETFSPFKNEPDEAKLIEEYYEDDNGIMQSRMVIQPAGGQLVFEGGKRVLLTETDDDTGIKLARVKKEFRLKYTKGVWSSKDVDLSKELIRVKPLTVSV
jgi:hypothetical protein